MENFIAMINRWVRGEPQPVVETRVAGWPEVERRLKERGTPEEMQDRAIIALDLQVEMAATEIRAKRISATEAGQKIFDGLSDDVKQLTAMTLAQILDAIEAELAMPEDARR